MKIRALVLALLFGSGSALTLAQDKAPAVPAAPAAAADAPAKSVVPADYVIGPGDTVQIFVWRNPELGSTVPVRPDGKISTPLVEDMVAVGKSPRFWRATSRRCSPNTCVLRR